MIPKKDFLDFLKNFVISFPENNLKWKLVLLLIFHHQSHIWEKFFCLQINTKIFWKMILSYYDIIFVTRPPQSTHITSLQYLCNISRKIGRTKLIFCLPVNIKDSSNWYYHFRCVWPGMPKLPKITSLLFAIS